MTYSTAELPLHLRQYIAEQDYSLYTPIDHASWRYIMRVSKEFFKDHAHPKYLEGLRETGVTIDRIPKISEMDQKLQKFGWRAVIITGFIPPEPFLEMLAHRILPIASDMRKLENIDYTPAPDIVHEAAGHAPILADPSYSAYLKKFGEIARRVIFAKEDNDLYRAVLLLSETKENPYASAEEIALAQKKLDEAVEKVGYVSEAQQVTRLGWWSTEYGLFEQNGKYLMYGAGLLSSVGESFNCLSDRVAKVPLTVNCIDTPYDITKPQPQLFVTDDFQKLEKVIDQLAEKMAYKHGGIQGLAKAHRAQTVTTTVFESGIQVSGVLMEYRADSKGTLTFIKMSGPVQLSYKEQELSGHGVEHHAHGFSSPIGKVRGLSVSPCLATANDWLKIGCREGQHSIIEFESGIKVEGEWTQSILQDGKRLVMSFKNCVVKSSDQEILFDPSWGVFDLILGETVVSVFGGAADRNAYLKNVSMETFKPRPQKCNLTAENKELNSLYGLIRDLRENNVVDGDGLEKILRVHEILKSKYPNEWLLRLEILELLDKNNWRPPVALEIKEKLEEMARESDRLRMLIQRGMELIFSDKLS